MIEEPVDGNASVEGEKITPDQPFGMTDGHQQDREAGKMIKDNQGSLDMPFAMDEETMMHSQADCPSKQDIRKRAHVGGRSPSSLNDKSLWRQCTWGV